MWDAQVSSDVGGGRDDRHQAPTVLFDSGSGELLNRDSLLHRTAATA